MGNWSSRIRNTWLLAARMNASAIRDRLKPLIDEKDRLFVARISKNWAKLSMSRCTQWTLSGTALMT